MDFAQLDKEYGHFYTPAFEIEVEGRNLIREGMIISGVTVDQSLEEADHFSFTIDHAFDAIAGDLKWMDLFLPATKRLTIRMGYAGKLKLMLVGMVTSMSVNFPASGTPQLEVSGLDLSNKLMQKKEPRSWNNMKHSDVVAALAAEYQLKSDVEDTKVPYPKITKDAGKNDFQLIQSLAQKNHFEFFVFGDTLTFRAPALDSTPVVKLEWRKTLISFQPELNFAGQVQEVEVRGWDPKSKKEIVGKARVGDEAGKQSHSKEKSGGELISSSSSEKISENARYPVFSQQEADQLARSILNQHAEGLIKGSAESIGIPDIQPGKRIELDGLGKRFSKAYYIEKSTHTIGGSGYTTTFHVKENAL
ncbi:phage late control D family protein [Paenibacillus sp. GCM10023250]|uniref:phage late control D family protein n=1 Tax=Paenibacillus sp. GCM10023250 TaxID=3252648 RepID=UPI0036220377